MYTTSVKELTANVDLQLTEVRSFFARKHQDEVSVGHRDVAGTLHCDCGASSNSARVLTAHGVVPDGRRSDDGGDIGQTDDEVVRSFGCT